MPTSGIIFKGDTVRLGKDFSVRLDQRLSDYQKEALKHKILTSPIVRIPWPGGTNVYHLRLTMEGQPPVRLTRTGAVKHPGGEGVVGIDIGTSTVAGVKRSADGQTVLVELDASAPQIDQYNEKIANVQRAMDRSRRDSNLRMISSDGQIIPIDKLDADLVQEVGGKKRRIWNYSRHYYRLLNQLRGYQAKAVRYRMNIHHQLANRLTDGVKIGYVETMQFQALAKRARTNKTTADEVKTDEVKTGAIAEADTTSAEGASPAKSPDSSGDAEETVGTSEGDRQPTKAKRTRRFGKSILNHAPGLLIEIIAGKPESHCGKLFKTNTREQKASQYKSLSQRWNEMPDGTRVQRDLYSAFLLSCTSGALNGYDQQMCEIAYTSFVPQHNAEIRRLSKRPMPSSAGVPCRPKRNEPTIDSS